jgi:hypothetical protein
MELIMSMPKEENVRGSQSIKVMWIGGSLPLSGEWENTEASRRVKNARENCVRKSVYVFIFHNLRLLWDREKWQA